MQYIEKEFYPTPEPLIQKMIDKVKWSSVDYILEPSAGKGHIVEKIKESNRRYKKISCIESNIDFMQYLRGKNYNVIDSDFLTYSGSENFDLIMMNPPFSEGDKHLLKAIDICHNGQIVCLLNAETIKNPYSNTRKLLLDKLTKLTQQGDGTPSTAPYAEITYMKDQFIDAERKTKVETALIYIDKRKDLSDFFAGCDDKNHINIQLEESKEVSKTHEIEKLVDFYNDDLNKGLNLIKTYFSNLNTFKGIIELTTDESNSLNSTKYLNDCVNSYIRQLREKYWNKVIKINSVYSRMTEEKIRDFRSKIQKYSYMDFTYNNINQFILNIINDYGNTLQKAVTEIFDKMSRKYSYYDECSKNTHYFNGWKTNKAFYVNKKVIIPCNGGYGAGFRGLSGWKVQYGTREALNDIDKVMNYFQDGNNYVSILDALTTAFQQNKTRGVKSTFFEISVYKKGTIHLTFLNEDIRRRFNIEACKDKKWLPEDYGRKDYGKMDQEEKSIVNSFEGEESYSKNIGRIGFSEKTLRIDIDT